MALTSWRSRRKHRSTICTSCVVGRCQLDQHVESSGYTVLRRLQSVANTTNQYLMLNVPSQTHIPQTQWQPQRRRRRLTEGQVGTENEPSPSS